MVKQPQLGGLWKTIAIATTMLLNACVSTPDIRVNSDENADFSIFSSYGFVEPLGTDKAGYTTLVTKYLKDAVGLELEKRGYRYSSKPDLLVNFYARLESRTQIMSVPTPLYYGGYYDYRYGGYGLYPHYAYRTYSYRYKEGTVNVDLIDARKKQMVWEGIAVNEVVSDDLDNPKLAFRKVIAAIFAHYPYQAGSALPVTDKSTK